MLAFSFIDCIFFSNHVTATETCDVKTESRAKKGWEPLIWSIFLKSRCLDVGEKDERPSPENVSSDYLTIWQIQSDR